MKLRFIILLLTLQTICFGQAPKSGYYDEGILVRNETNKTIQGYFNSNIGGGHITCLYEFRGTYKNLNDKAISVTAFWPDSNDKISGKLTCETDTSFILKFESPLPGDMACLGVSQEGLEFKLTLLKNWLSIKIAKSKKVFLYKEPKESTKPKAYIIGYDAVGVIEDKGDWLFVNFQGEKLITGWVKKNDFYR